MPAYIMQLQGTDTKKTQEVRIMEIHKLWSSTVWIQLHNYEFLMSIRILELHNCL